ncbi:MAG TPA: redoxin domain-containing protein [Terriglobia bacterium]|nr:redoxin domain-containing protein [Terriglobia bacterium]
MVKELSPGVTRIPQARAKLGTARLGLFLPASVLLALCLAAPVALKAAGQSSSQTSGLALGPDDITLLLIGGATESKLIPLIQQRGVDFRMTPELAKKFHDLGASDRVIDALSRAAKKVVVNAPAAAPVQPPSTVPPPGNSSPPAPAAASPTVLSHSGSVPENSSEARVQRAVQDANTPELGKPLGPAPEFSLRTFTGSTFDLANEKGKVVLVDFWATWCKPCREEIPSFMDLEKRYKSQGLRIVGIGVSDKLQTVRDFYDRYAMNYPVGMGDARLKALFGGIVSIPTALLIGPDGMIYYKAQGSVIEPVLEKQIQALLAAGSASAHPRVASSSSPAMAPNPPKAPVAGAAAPVTAASVASGSPAGNAAPPRSGVALPDPSPARIQQIIQSFAAKEKLFKQARQNYTWHQVNKVQTLDADGNATGSYEQDWDILFDNNGQRIERVTYAPEDTLKGLIVTEQDIDSFRNVQPFVMTTDDLPEYEVRYLGHVHVDYITAYVFSIRPKVIKKGKQYFKGVIWVDDRDLQIVKAEGKPVPELTGKHGQNLFPRFTTWRQQIDGKYWFPTFTMANDTLYFNQGPIRIKEIIKYTNYKQFKSKVKISPATPISDPPATPPKH